MPQDFLSTLFNIYFDDFAFFLAFLSAFVVSEGLVASVAVSAFTVAVASTVVAGVAAASTVAVAVVFCFWASVELPVDVFCC